MLPTTPPAARWSSTIRCRTAPDTSRLGFVAQLAFYRAHARFPDHRNAFAPAVLAHLAEQIGVLAFVIDDYEWTDRTGRRHREVILDQLGVRPFDDAAEDAFRAWLMTRRHACEPKREQVH